MRQARYKSFAFECLHLGQKGFLLDPIEENIRCDCDGPSALGMQFLKRRILDYSLRTLLLATGADQLGIGTALKAI